MSTQRGHEVRFQHFNDCQQAGCRGHALRIAYHGTSDTKSVEIDGEPVYFFDENVFHAILEAHAKDVEGWKQDAERWKKGGKR